MLPTRVHGRHIRVLLSGGALLAVVLVAVSLLPGARPAAAAPEEVRFDTPGAHVFTVPPGVTEITVEAWGGGGGGGNAVNLGVLGVGLLGGGGGGGGAYARATFAVVPGTDYTVTVGAGGAPTLAGEDTSFGGGVVMARGGEPGVTGAGGAGGAAGTSTGDITQPGGPGGAGAGNLLAIAAGGGGGGSALPGGPGGMGGDGTLLIPGAGGAGTGDGGRGGILDLLEVLPDLGAEDGVAPGGGGGGAGLLPCCPAGRAPMGW